MTPRQARVALVTFMLVAAGVAYNALYLQGEAVPGRRMASDTPPSVSARADSRPSGTMRASQAGTRAASLKQADAPKASSREAGGETIRAIQRELNARGYGPVANDGIIRPVMRAAIMSFEHDNRLPLTGEATEALLARLVLGAPATDRDTLAGAGQVQSQHAEDTVKQVQRLLAANGYRPGPVDGRLRTETTDAIRAFEQDQGLPGKGRVSAEVVNRLQASSGKLKAAEAR